jgi:hypothetical protein
MCLIRVSPMPPWVYSISLFAVGTLQSQEATSLLTFILHLQSIRTVSVWQFMVATFCSWPRYFLYVFIGSRLALVSDGKSRAKMDTGERLDTYPYIGKANS